MTTTALQRPTITSGKEASSMRSFLRGTLSVLSRLRGGAIDLTNARYERRVEGIGRAAIRLCVRRDLCHGEGSRIRFPPRSVVHRAVPTRAARLPLRHRGRGRLDPYRRGARAARDRRACRRGTGGPRKTNMAGRGTDIRLGGSDERDRGRVIALGGLLVLGTNRHESRRIDNQLRGRAGRQGDPGESRFFGCSQAPTLRLCFVPAIPVSSMSWWSSSELKSSGRWSAG